MAIGYNYLIKDTISEPAIYKIGISSVLDRRLKQLKDGILTAVVGIWSSPYYEDLEKQLHKLFPMKRLPQSEWFKLSEAEVIKVIASTSQQAKLEFLIPKYKPSEPAVIESELFKAELKPSVRQAVKPNRTTYPVPVRSARSGPNPVWTDHTGATSELPQPSIKEQQKREQLQVNYSRPAVVATSTTNYSSTTQEQPPAWCGFFAFVPFFGWLVAISALLDFKSERYTTEFKIISVLSALMSVAIAANSEVKPLTTYQFESPQNVSSLIY